VPDSITFPAQQNFSQQCARAILQQAADSLPDLSQLHIIIPNALAAHQLRLALSQHKHSCLLGPFIGSLAQWMNERIALPDAQTTRINAQAKKLLLLEALKQHPDLFSAGNSWQVCDSLLILFDELTDCGSSFLDSDEQQWIDRLNQCYHTPVDIQHLNHEARIVFQLWQAWLQQMSAMNVIDSASAYQQQLKDSADIICSNDYFFIIGEDELKPAERAWCQQLQQKNQLCFINQSVSCVDDASKNPLSQLLASSFDQRTPLYARTQSTQKRPIEHFTIFNASNAEQEALAIELKTRLWLLAGNKRIAIVTEDRKLARRVRALLQRAGIIIQDTAGWSLSTTSSATIIERWLECIEQDFDHQPLLDLLKSPFFYNDTDKAQHLNQVYRFEQDIILHENIPRDINRYIHAMSLRRKKLNWPEQTYENLIQILDKLKNTATDLHLLFSQNSLRPAEKYLHSMTHSLIELGIHQKLDNDLAGKCIITVLQNMQQGLKFANPEMSWQDFRTWLGASLEQEAFTPQAQPSAVQLMNLKQAQYCQFDALIIAGASKESLPGSARQQPFFNQSVRAALNLPTWHNDKRIAAHRFRCLLESADHVLISYCSENNGEWQQPSPWVSSIVDFAQLGLNIDLQDSYLRKLLQQYNSAVNECDITNTPEISQPPAPQLDALLTPSEYSASRHQRLINCPYQFFAADVLSLRAGEHISEELQKSDFGEKVHLILQAFHLQVKNLLAPFNKPLNNDNRELALQHMKQLSTQVFNLDTEDNVQHREWLQRWLNIAPHYIDWQIQRQSEWKIHALEQKQTVKISDSVAINGRLDRVDKRGEDYAIIDYKTGLSARQDKVNAGEDVQLVSYASMLDNVSEVAYFELSKDKARIASSLADEDLVTLKELSQKRLIELVAQLRQGSNLHAWGDEKACQYCNMQGLCRKQSWL
jgi:ATP-dependent helicase/nuclease subunit B